MLARMNAMTAPIQAPAKDRISPAVREAVRLRVREGATFLEAAKRAGLSEAGIHKAWKRPAVLALIEQEQAQYIQEVEALRAGYKAQAFEVAADLMRNAKSEAVRMRAVEFLAGGPPQTTVNVQVNNAAPGYSYARPSDRASTSTDRQHIEIEGKATEV